MSPAPKLPPREVHIWRMPLDPAPGADRRLGSLLSEEELGRADRFVSSEDRRRFVIGRGSVRSILGRYLEREPGGLSWRLGAWGKPELDEGLNPPAFRFNTTHSGDLALLAIARDHPLGIDVERLRPLPDAPRIVERFFSMRERSVFFGLPEDRRLEAFFRAWTRKEAYLKATGEGLSFPLENVEVTLGPEEPPALVHVVGRPREQDRWSLRDLPSAVGSSFVGALVAEGSEWSVRVFSFDPGP